jgi:hypothetical protein
MRHNRKVQKGMRSGKKIGQEGEGELGKLM